MSKYKELINNMTWSYSRLTSFEQCKYGFYLGYIINDNNKYLSEGNFYAEVGGFMHSILEKIFKKELSINNASQYYLDNFDKNVFYKTKPSIMNKTYEACANYLSETDFSWINKYEILGVEKKVEFKIDKYNFVGYIDLLLRDKKNNEIIVLDHKSSTHPLKKNGEVKSSSKHSFDKYKIQMYLYSHSVFLEYGVHPKFLVWNHFKEGKFAKIPFEELDYDKAIVWMIDTIHNIENEEEFEPKEDFFYCNNICNFRNCCEYKQNNKLNQEN